MWVLGIGPLQEQPVFLTTESSLWPHASAPESFTREVFLDLETQGGIGRIAAAAWADSPAKDQVGSELVLS